MLEGIMRNNHPAKNASDFQKACRRAEPGDTITLTPGTYRSSTKLQARSNVTILPGAPGWIDGGLTPTPTKDSSLRSTPPKKPTTEEKAFLIIIDCSDIVLDGLCLKNFWPNIVLIKNSRNITIRNCQMKGGTYAIFAKGKAADDPDDDSMGYLIEGNCWQQDDTADHKLWTQFDWAEAHGGEGGEGSRNYFNGAFFGAKAIRGGVIIRGNTITDAYNGIRMKAANERPTPDTLPRLNADVHIYENLFLRIRDNPIEPEYYALDWHVRHNRLIDCHTWFSFDGVGGGYWYFYGNTGGFTSRQGPSADERHTMGRVLKLSYEQLDNPGSGTNTMPTRPWYVFNNSWYLRCPLIGGNNPCGNLQINAANESNDFR